MEANILIPVGSEDFEMAQPAGSIPAASTKTSHEINQLEGRFFMGATSPRFRHPHFGGMSGAEREPAQVDLSGLDRGGLSLWQS